MTYDELEKKWGLDPACYSGIGDGWVPIVDTLLTKLSAEGVDLKTVSQIKEKFGGLRVYVDASLTDAQDAYITEAEAEAWKTCDQCGAAGSIRTDRGWRVTRCDSCAVSK